MAGAAADQELLRHGGEGTDMGHGLGRDSGWGNIIRESDAQGDSQQGAGATGGYYSGHGEEHVISQRLIYRSISRKCHKTQGSPDFRNGLVLDAAQGAEGLTRSFPGESVQLVSSGRRLSTAQWNDSAL